jgi:hypothetical protein
MGAQNDDPFLETEVGFFVINAAILSAISLEMEFVNSLYCDALPMNEILFTRRFS